MAAPKDEKIQIEVFLENLQDIETVREALENLNIKKNDIIRGGIKEAIEFVSKKKSPPYLIIDVSKSDMPVSDLNKLADLCGPGVNVVAVGTRNDVALYRDLMKLGIFDYLVSPLFADIVGRSLKSFLFGEEDDKKSGTKFGKIIAFVGARGGAGTSFLATNFAALVSKEKSRRILLLDLDLHFGTDSLYFDLKQNSGLREALEDPDHMDSLFIERLLVPVNDRLSLLSSEENLDETLSYKVEGIEFLLKQLSEQSHYVAIDVPHCFNNITQTVISQAHIMVLVTDPSLAGLRDTGRLIQLFGPEEGGRKVMVVINKSGLYNKGEVTASDFETTLSHKISHVLPFDKNSAMDLVNRGKILVEEQSDLASSIRALVNDIIGSKDSEEPTTSWFSGLFKRN